MRLPAFSKQLQVEDAVSGVKIGTAQVRIRGRKAEVNLPLDSLGEIRQVHVKLEQPTWFFDFAGWREIPISQVAVTASVQHRTLPTTVAPPQKFAQPIKARAAR